MGHIPEHPFFKYTCKIMYTNQPPKIEALQFSTFSRDFTFRFFVGSYNSLFFNSATIFSYLRAINPSDNGHLCLQVYLHLNTVIHSSHSVIYLLIHSP